MTCPDCDNEFLGRACACGYSMPKVAPAMPEYAPVSHQGKRTQDSYRARWYRENKLPYAPANVRACPPFRCVGRDMPMREPGDC